MMCRYDQLRRSPGVFLKMTGLRVGEFEPLLIDMLPRIADADHIRLQRADRRRAPRAGRHTDLARTNQLLLTVMWLRVSFHRAFAKRRIKVDHTIGRMRRYQCLSHTDRHHRRNHTAWTRAVAGLVNRRIRSRLAC